MTARVALLRGINVTAGRSIGMAALRSCFEELGLSGVETYLRSGNVVFDADDAPPGALRRDIEAAIAGGFGFHVPVVLRSGADLRAIVAGCPYADIAAVDPTRVVVGFLDGPPDPDGPARLAAAHTGPERFQVRGANVYIHYPEGQGRSKLSADRIDRAFGATVTARNWNTVTALAGILARRDPHA